MIMFGPRLGNGFSFGKILGGINKTLNVVNQMIPIYKEAKPLMSNAKSAINFIKEMSTSTTNRVMNNTQKNLEPLKEKIKNVQNSVNQKGPTFFQ